MSDLLAERTVTCPTCWEPNSYLLDLSASEQTFIEDCQQLELEVVGCLHRLSSNIL